jgi:hypothetical protein
MQQEKQAHALDAFLQRFHDESSGGSRDEPEETYHVYPVPGGMVILKEDPEDQVVEAAIPPNTEPPSRLFTAATVIFALLLPLSAILFQLSLAFNPPIITVTLVPAVQSVTVRGMVHIGRLIPPITLSQAATTKTTGRGHEDAKQARGFITLYNGQFTAQTVPAGTVLTGADGIQIVTDQDALIPAGNPPSYGHVSIAAHALQAGRQGNMQAYDITAACCFASVLAKNPEPFTGGADERDYQTVAKADIDNAARPLKTSLSESIKGAFQGQLKPGEHVETLPCSPAVSPDHQIGDEATTVTVTVSATCRAAAYNTDALSAKAQELLSRLAANKAGTRYRLFGQAHVTLTQASVDQQKNVVLSIIAQGTFVSVLSYPELEHLKQRIAGKTAHGALLLLKQTPGIQDAYIMGRDGTTTLPRNASLIQFILFFRA